MHHTHQQPLPPHLSIHTIFLLPERFLLPETKSSSLEQSYSVETRRERWGKKHPFLFSTASPAGSPQMPLFTLLASSSSSRKGSGFFLHSLFCVDQLNLYSDQRDKKLAGNRGRSKFFLSSPARGLNFAREKALSGKANPVGCKRPPLCAYVHTYYRHVCRMEKKLRCLHILEWEPMWCPLLELLWDILKLSFTKNMPSLLKSRRCFFYITPAKISEEFINEIL